VGRKQPTLADPVRADRVEPVVEPGAFKIIHTHIVLRHDPDKYPLYGDVAMLASGRLRCRFSFPGVDGTLLVGYRGWAEDEDVKKTQARADDWCYQFRAKLRNAPLFQSLLPSEKEFEYRRFCASYPTLARSPAVIEQFGDAAKTAPQLFDLGATQFMNPREFGWGQEFWRRYVLMHANGNFGMFGTFIAKEWSPDEVWTRDELAHQNERNSIAIATRQGGVISRFVLDDHDQAQFPRPVRLSGPPIVYGDRPVRFVEVSSAPFLRSGAQTICTIGEVNPYENHQP
jgi:hypothetical protein